MILRFSVIIINLFFTVNVFSQINTNQEIVEFKTIELLDSIVLKLPNNIDTIALDFNNNNEEIKSFLLNQFVKYFAKYNITISLDSAAFKVVLENIDIKTKYQETKRGILGLSSIIERIILFKVSGFIIDSNKMEVMNTIQFDSTYDDVVKTSELNIIENSQYTFCRGTMINALSWTKYIEPGIVLASVVGIVFLLFTMRF